MVQSIEQAKISFNKERKSLIEKEEKTIVNLDVISSNFDKTPDLEKPFFMAQFGWRVAEKRGEIAEGYKARALAAEEELKNTDPVVIAKKMRKEIVRQESARIRHQKDPKYLSKKLRQAKKRLNNKKK